MTSPSTKKRGCKGKAAAPKQTSNKKRNRSGADLDDDSDVEDLDMVVPGKVVDKAAHDKFMRSAGYTPVPSAPFVPGHCFFDALRHAQLYGEPKGGLVLGAGTGAVNWAGRCHLHTPTKNSKRWLNPAVRREEERRKKKKKKEREEKGGGKRDGGGEREIFLFSSMVAGL